MKRTLPLKSGALAQVMPILIGYSAYLLATPFIVATLGITQFGMWALTGAIAQYGGLLDLGVSRAVVRFVALSNAREEERDERAVVGLAVLIIALMGSVLTLLVSLIPSPLSRLIKTDDVHLTRVLFISAIVILIGGLLGTVFAGASIGRGRPVLVNFGIGVQRASVVLGGVIALIIAPSLIHFAIGSAVGSVAGLLCVLLCVLIDEREIIIGRPHSEIARQFVKFSLKSQVLSISDVIGTQSGKIIIGILIGPAASGVYELGNRLALGAKSLSNSFGVVLSAHQARSLASEGREGVRRDYLRLVTRACAVGNFPLFLLAAVAVNVVVLWLGRPEPEVAKVAIVLAVGFTANLATAVPGGAVFATGELGLLLWVHVTGWVLALGLQVPLGMAFGLNGVLIGMAAAIVLNTILAVALINRRLGVSSVAFLKAFMGPLAVGALSMAVATGVGSAFSAHDRLTALAPLAVSTAVFSLLYIFLGWRRGYLPRFTGFSSRRSV